MNKITVDGYSYGDGSQTIHDCDIGMLIDLDKTNYNTKLMLRKFQFIYTHTQQVLQIGLLQGASSENTMLIKSYNL